MSYPEFGPKETPAWAVVKDGVILVNTVYESRIGVIVNYLLTEEAILTSAATSDERIEKAWVKFKSPSMDVVEITLTLKQRVQ